MDSQKIASLLKSVELGSFMKAAQVLGYTPSGLVHMMNGLEKEMGFPLTIRGRFGVKLSPEGERLAPFFEQLVKLNEQIDQEIQQIKEGKQEVIRVGTYSSIATHWMPDLIRGFKALYPNVEINIRVGGIEELCQLVEQGEIDLCFSGRYKQGNMEFIPLKEDPLMAVLPENHPLGKRSNISLMELDGESLIIPSFGLDYEVRTLLEEAKITPILQGYCVDDAAVLSMVTRGLGISILSELVLQGYTTQAKIIPLSPGGYRDLGIGIASFKHSTEIVKRFVQFTQAFKLV